ncbi:uncharacterized protein LOC123662116 [Melitaea cinxia]|uniref:uncharacterized protein LOC123662116 n=1 Tax=Melitaea cinxia TaxID=113334 RepID=UPI001E271475|nr:uncharacterized protein LOC123662116 [Melitaea cinxia]
MESFNDLQEDIRTKMLKVKTNFKKSPKDRLTVAYIETRLDNLEQQWTLFTDTHAKIISQVKRTDLYSSDYHKNSVYDDVEELYVQFKTELKEMLYKLKAPELEVKLSSNSQGESSARRFKLPEIKIPTFSGKYTEWQTFRDLFLGLVHENKSLDDAQRFYYLRGHLTGEAEQLLRNIKVTSDSYQVAWEKLDSMYNNKRFLANGILKRLLSQKSLMSESASEIKNLICTTSDCLDSIKNIGVDVSSWDILIIHIISAKLDKDTRKAWELKVSSDPSDELPTFQDFSNFLIGRFRGLENIDFKVHHSEKKFTKSFHVVKNKPIVSCAYCNADHKITTCKRFGKESNEKRREFVLDKNLCFICLNSNHSAKLCKNIVRCQVCKRRHHSLLHPSGDSGSGSAEVGAIHQSTSSTSRRSTDEDTAASSDKLSVPAECLDKTLVSCFSTGSCSKTVLLTTAVVQAESKDGTHFPVRALLDQGSQSSFITEAMVQRLGLKRLAVKNTIVGVGGDKSVTSKSTVKINLRSRVDPRFQVKVNAYVLKSVTSLLPVAKATRVEWENLTLDDLADPEYHTPNKIDILLGAEIFSQIIQEGIKRNFNGSLLAQDTAFGWIISGVCEVDSTSNIHSHITVMHSYLELDNMLKRFWELEAEPPVTKRMLTDEEIKCEKLFKDTTKRDGDGRFIVKLPFRTANPDCMRGEFRKIAEKRLRNLEFKLLKNIRLKEDYIQVIREYLNLNHMVKVTDKDKFKETAIYLPHHAVVREDKDTTKVRVVFDASCKGSNGKSLNDDLLIGPPLQAELRHIIMRWRQYKICLVADVVKMYRQVLVNREDTPFQRILWRDSPEKELQEFELLTVTFGTACAPYLAVRSLQELAYKECQNKPEIAKIILNDFYMDDVMTGSETLEDAYKIYKELTEVLAKGGFPLQKWKSNSKEILAKIWKAKGNKDEELRIRVDDTTKILGLTWDQRGDFFRYSVDLAPQEEPVTKRKIISDISRLFDPLGWLAPCIIAAKILIQKLWLAGIGWDEQVPTNLIIEWNTYRKNLTALQNIKIPRWIHTCNKYKRELYGFADASKVAYAAVVYLRVVDEVGNVYVSLVTSKTKVAPIKQVSIPRLELCGAVLLAKLMIEVAGVMKVEKNQLHAFTDSEVVLAWLNNHPSRWKTFVANRVSEILQILDTHHWSHVTTKKNPADCASRGISPAELSEMAIWFEGPEFLKNKVIRCTKPKHLVTNLEQVKVHTAVVDTTLWQRFSSFSKLVRVVAYCRRWLRLRKGSSSMPSLGALERQEIEDAIKVYSEGIIRVGGRLEMSSLSFNEKYPILIPKESFLSGLLIADAHQKTLHGGPQLMITYLRSKYWIVGAKSLIKKYYRSCVTCTRYSNRSTSQLMGQLPSARVNPNKPFLISGVDYAGPINIRISKGRGNKSYKGYIALFICMSTRAVHLEAVSELSTQGFIAAFKRFVARRGRCAELYSDNGTNFVGAARQLLCLFNEEKTNFKPELAEYLATNGTQWNFIPPRAPNFGGLWEAGIKSTKFHLKRVVGNSTLTYEEMATVLSQIEACLNSRPLSRVEDQTEVVVLTPGHFLVGEPLIVVPDANYESSNMYTLRRWQFHQRMMQDFWRRWSQDYLHQFLQRHKWEYQNPEPSLGDVVLVKEDDLPPARWLLDGAHFCRSPVDLDEVSIDIKEWHRLSAGSISEWDTYVNFDYH